MKLLQILTEELQVDYELYTVPDGAFGGYSNGTWNGIMREMYLRKADIGVQGLTPTSQRLRDVDFTVSFVDTYLAILRLKKSELSPINWRFLDGLEVSLLVAVLVSSFLAAICIYIFENVRYIFQRKPRVSSGEIMSYIWINIST